MNSEIDSDSKMCNDGRRNVQFFEITGRTLVHPVVYRMQEFQKNIILTGILNNTLISLPPGLGKLYIAAVIVFNFHRWFLNGKIVVLSQTKSYLTDLISAFDSYTQLPKDAYTDLPVNAQMKDCISALEKSAVLTSPQKLLNLLDQNVGKIHNIVLLLILETNKVMKCAEYGEILKRLGTYEYRLLLFVDPVGFNSKMIRQITDEFGIAKIEIRNLDSADIKECTFRTQIESVAVDISPHIISIKDSFYAVFEKYGKNLKDAKMVNGNVASLTKSQILKAKEKFLKNPPLNLPKTERDELVDCMAMCAFLCHGIELLHNWGVRVFYNYLFDDQKDAELKGLIVKDDHLMNQMKLLNDYLKNNGKKLETSLSLIVHPKLIHLKHLVTNYFSNTESDIENVRIIVVCSLDDVVDEIDRLFRSLPDFVRYHCIKTKAKSLASEPKHKEVVKNFLDGVITVLVLSNLVDEVMEMKSSLIVSLNPNKTLLKSADARFFEGAEKCIFILTKGTEFVKFESLLNEKRNEQKPLDVFGIDSIANDSPQLFPADFCPELECTGINAPKQNFKNSPGQKTMFQYLKSNQNCSSPSLFESSVTSRQSNTTVIGERFSNLDSPSLFASDTDFDFSTPVVERAVSKLDDDSDFDLIADAAYEIPEPVKRPSNFDAKTDENDSFDELILDFSPSFLKNSPISKPVRKISAAPLQPANKTPTTSSRKKFSWTKRSSGNLIIPSILDDSSTKVKNTSLAKLVYDDTYGDSLFPDSLEMDVITNHEMWKTAETKSKSSSVTKSMYDDTYGDSLFPDSPKTDVITDHKRLKTMQTKSKNPCIAKSVYSDTHGDYLFPDSSNTTLTTDRKMSNTGTTGEKKSSASVHDMNREETNLSKSFVDSVISDSSCELVDSFQNRSKTPKSEIKTADFLFLKRANPDSKVTPDILSADSILECSSTETAKKHDLKRSSPKSVVDGLFADCSSPDRIDDSFNGSKLNDISFVDDLFANSPSPRQINDTDDIVESSSKALAAASVSDSEVDSDCDLVPGSPDANRRTCDVFSSRSIETLNASQSFSCVVSPDQVDSKSVLPATKFDGHGLFSDSMNSTVYDLRYSFKERSTMSDLLLSNIGSMKSAADPAISFTDVPSKFLTAFVPESPTQVHAEPNTPGKSASLLVPESPTVTIGTPGQLGSVFVSETAARVNADSTVTNVTPQLPRSPVLFSSKKLNRKRPSDNQSSSIKFDSSFDVSEEQFQQLDSVVKSKTTPEVVKQAIDDVDFDSIFGDDSIFRNMPDGAQKADLTPIAGKVETTKVSPPILIIGNTVESNVFRGSLTPKHSGFSGEPVVVDATHGRPSTPELVPCVTEAAVTPKELSFSATENAGDDSNPVGISSTASTPESLLFANFTTPDELRKRNENKVPSRQELLVLRMSSTKTGNGERLAVDSKLANSNFSDGSFDLGDYSTPRRLQLKPMSPAINCDSAPSSDRASSSTSTPNHCGEAQLSTMDRLHIVNGRSTIPNVPANEKAKTCWANRSPLFDDSEANFDSPLPRFPLTKRKSRPLFANYAQLMKHKSDQANAKRRLLNGRAQAAVSSAKNALDSDDEFSWLKKSPCGAATTPAPCFKKPEPLLSLHSSRHSTPMSNQNSDSGSSSTPDLPIQRRPKKRCKLKRNLVEQFFDKEAEVSGSDNDDCDEGAENCSQFSVDSFIDDESVAKPSNITNYLKSLKSPQNAAGKFHIPVLSESRLKVNVCSQIEDYEHSYENDSFCVDENESELEDEYAPSVLTQMEEQLKKRKFNKLTPKPRHFKRIIEDSSPDSPGVRKKSRQRVRHIVSSDSD